MGEKKIHGENVVDMLLPGYIMIHLNPTHQISPNSSKHVGLAKTGGEIPVDYA